MKKICEYCQTEFETRYTKQKCCSLECGTKNRYKNIKIEKEIRVCEFDCCNNTFEVYPNTKNKKRFCSRDCQVEWQKTSQLGENNGNYGRRYSGLYKHTDIEKEKIRVKVTESWANPSRLEKHLAFFEKHRLEDGTMDWSTPEMRENISKRNIERLLNNCENSAYSNCKKGYYHNNKINKEEYYHSSWELERMCDFDNDDNVIYWTKAHKIIIKYQHNGITKRYYPDFYLEFSNGIKLIEEVKGYVKPCDIEQLKLKIKSAKKYCSEHGFHYITNYMKNKYKYKDLIEWEKELK